MRLKLLLHTQCIYIYIYIYISICMCRYMSIYTFLHAYVDSFGCCTPGYLPPEIKEVSKVKTQTD